MSIPSQNAINSKDDNLEKHAGQVLNHKDATAIELKLSHYINSFFRFFEKHRKDEFAQAREILRLDRLWKNYLVTHPVYDYTVFCNKFAEKLNHLFEYQIKLHVQIEYWNNKKD